MADKTISRRYIRTDSEEYDDKWFLQCITKSVLTYPCVHTSVHKDIVYIIAQNHLNLSFHLFGLGESLRYDETQSISCTLLIIRI